MFELIEKIEPSKQFLQEPEIFIDGSSEDGSRKLTVSIPVVNESNQRVRVITKEYTGKDFNEIYLLYVDDKTLFERVLLDLNIEADISNLSEDLMNK